MSLQSQNFLKFCMSPGQLVGPENKKQVTIHFQYRKKFSDNSISGHEDSISGHGNGNSISGSV